jgi:hypothetical protein
MNSLRKDLTVQRTQRNSQRNACKSPFSLWEKGWG